MTITYYIGDCAHTVGDSKNFFETLALLQWRHSGAVLADVRETKRAAGATREKGLPASQIDLDFLTSMGDQIDLLTTAATSTIVASREWEQFASADTYLELFRLAEQGKALNTSFQFHSFLNFVGLSNSSVIGFDIFNLRAPDAVEDFTVGPPCYFVPTNIQDFWSDVRSKIETSEDCVTAFDILGFVRSSLIAKVRIRTRRLNAFTLSVPKSAPSTREWVHRFVLWTGISPPAQASEVDTIDVQTQKLIAEDKYRELFCRQEDRRHRARAPCSRRSGRSSKARRSPDRYLKGGRKLGGDALCGAWTRWQAASQQAA